MKRLLLMLSLISSAFIMQGVPVYEGPVDSFNKTALQSGIYIQSGVNRAGNTITSKILVP